MLRDGAAAMGLGTFYKYAELLGIQRSKLQRREVKRYSPLRADGPLRILHMDVTVMRTADNIRCYIYIIQCNFSRAILAIRASLHCNAQTAMENLRQAVTNLNLWNVPLQLITDDGSENKGAVLDFLLREDVDIQKLIAQVDIRSSNSMIEAANKRLKYDFLYRLKPPDFESLVALLPKIMEEYNSKPLHVLHGLTPSEALSGLTPNKTRLQAMISQARQGRRELNRKADCSIC
jgi:transposase InsO family protein